MKRLFLSSLALAAALSAASAGPALAQYDNHDGGPYHSEQDNARSTSGVIATVNGSNVRLRDGRNIFLKDGTVINPRGTRLQPGMRIDVRGWRGGNGSINAADVQVLGWNRGDRHDDDDSGYQSH